MDNNQTTKSYPRPGHDTRAARRKLKILGTTDNTISLNVGVAQANQTFTPTGATYDAETGNLTMAIGQHGMRKGSSIVIADNSLQFTCDMDGNSATKTYPRSTDLYGGGKSIEVTDVFYNSCLLYTSPSPRD